MNKLLYEDLLLFSVLYHCKLLCFRLHKTDTSKISEDINLLSTSPLVIETDSVSAKYDLGGMV